MTGAANVRQAEWIATRQAGLDRLHAFLPFAGAAYARGRNVDRGPDDRSNVSALSPWIRRRMITEQEVVAAVLARHDLAAAGKFIQEVFWRSYWKGWLEMRPGVLGRYDADHETLSQAWRDNPALEAARRGETGIDAFDAWARELVELGWLHNHARMWFASIWIFTLRLPWQLGAGFFYDHLLDADPASNTLSWRWVAGLHTKGKHYLARASNIRDNTLGRFDPAGELDEMALPLTQDWATPSPSPVPAGERLAASRAAILLTEEDLHPESWSLEADIAGCAVLVSPSRGDPDAPAARFTRGALEDAAARMAAHFGAASALVSADEIISWAQRAGVTEIVTGYAPVGRTAQCVDAIQLRLRGEGIRLVRLQRAWDARTWPHARAGFFKLKEQIPRLIAAGER